MAVAVPTPQYGALPLPGLEIEVRTDGQCEVILPPLAAWVKVLSYLPRVVQRRLRGAGFLHDLRELVRRRYPPSVLAAG